MFFIIRFIFPNASSNYSYEHSFVHNVIMTYNNPDILFFNIPLSKYINYNFTSAIIYYII